jgi:hypothetical protein
VLTLLVVYVNISKSLWTPDSAKWYHSTALINSVGTGKTKAAFDLGHTRVVYVTLQKEGNRAADSCPLWSRFYQAMFEKLLDPHAGKDKVAKMILYTLVKASLDYDTAAELAEAQFETQEYHAKVKSCWETYPSPNKLGEDTSKVTFVDDAFYTCGKPLLIVIDETMAIVETDFSGSNSRALRRAVSMYQHCYIVFVSTSSHISNVAPHHSDSPRLLVTYD